MLGLAGEQKAKEYLIEKGYKFVTENYHSKFGEIDLIMSNETFIVFVEVKTRKTNPMVSGVESITPAKQRKIIVTAGEYIVKKMPNLQPRFDVVTVTHKDGEYYIDEHLENAFH